MAGAPRSFAPLFAAPSPNPSPSHNDVLFDGRTPSGRELLARAEEAALDLRHVGSAIQQAPTLERAAETLIQYGILSKDEAPRPGRRFAFEQALRRVWYEAAPRTPAPYSIDPNWAIPALVVRKEGITYYIHAIVHGAGMAVRPGPVRALVQSLESKGLALYSEQELPWTYAFSWGKETLDHRVKLGQPAELRDVPFEDAGQGVWKARSALKAAFVGSLAGLPLLLLLAHPTSLAAWTGAVLGAGLAWSAAEALLPFFRLFHYALAIWVLLKVGSTDLAHRLWSTGTVLFGRSLDLEALRRVEFPMPLRSERRSSTLARSEAMADLVGDDAARRGLREAHILAGFDHAQELAWRLTQGPRP